VASLDTSRGTAHLAAVDEVVVVVAVAAVGQAASATSVARRVILRETAQTAKGPTIRLVGQPPA